MPLTEHLNEANRAVGVQGSLFVSGEGEVLAAVMPASVDLAKLSGMARHIARSLGALEPAKRKTTELDLTFTDLRLLVRAVKPGYLVLLCLRTANVPLIDLSLGPIAKKIAAELKPKPAPAGAAAGLAPLAPTTEPEASQLAGAPPRLATESSAAIELPPLLKHHITEAQLIVRAAEYEGLAIRVLGSAGAALHCRSSRQWMLPPSRNVLELGASSSAGPALIEVLQSLGFIPVSKFNESMGGRRFVFRKAPDDSWADVHCGAYEMYHRVEFEDVLTQEELVLPATQTFLVRLQTAEINDADLRDLAALLADHEVSVGPVPDSIDVTLITALCAEDWGWYRTALRNLERLRSFASWESLQAPRSLRERIDGLHQSLERAQKSVRWQMRARMGDSVRWYKSPVFPAQAAGEAPPG